MTIFLPMIKMISARVGAPFLASFARSGAFPVQRRPADFDYEPKCANTLLIPSANSPSAVIKLNTKYPSPGKS